MQFVCIYTQYIYTQNEMCVSIYTYIYVCLYTYIHNIYTRNVCVSIYIYMYVYIHTDTHTHTHILMPTVYKDNTCVFQ